MSTFYRRDEWVTDAMGNAISGADVYVCSQPATTTTLPPSPLQQLYADPAGVTPITQPVITDGFGHAFYYVASGTYTVEYYSPLIGTTVLTDQDVAISSGNITFPITVAEGGTNATTAADARTNLVAAESGGNSDITSLAALSTLNNTGPTPIVITGEGGVGATAISVSDGIHTSTWAANGTLTVGGISAAGISCAGLQSSAAVVANVIENATPATPVTVEQSGGGAVCLMVTGVGVSLQSLLGFSNYPTQTTVGAAGSASALPATPSIYLQLNVNGTVYVFPGYKQI